MRHEGKITHWNEDKGYGFLTPTSGGNQLFIHINDISNRNKPPDINDIITFEYATDSDGRSRASKARCRKGDTPSRNLLAMFFAILYVVTVAVITLITDIPDNYFYYFAGICSLTFFTYGFDKSAAQRGNRRIKENTLHGMALLGGWPGAIIAQETLRHKSKKRDFLLIFWTTVVLNFTLSAILLTDAGSAFLFDFTHLTP